MARVRELAGRPIAQYSSPNVGGRMSEHRGIVLHIAEGWYQGTVAWQMNPNQRYADGTRVTTSSTWIVGREPGEWAQMADSDTIAWAQRDGSRTWLSIELVGFTRGHSLNPGGWEKPTAWQIEACAQLLAWCHRQHGIPLQVASSPSGRGLGHHSMGAPAWGHSQCPGPDIIAVKGRIVARAKEILEEEMPSADDVAKAVWLYRSTITGRQYGSHVRGAERGIASLAAGQAAILARLDGADDGATRQAIRDELDRHRAALLAEVREDLADLAELVRKRNAGELTAEQVVDELARRLSGGGDDD